MSDRDALLRTLRDEGIRDERVLQAMARVRREEFVDPDLRACAYDNEALPIPQGQTISQPTVVAVMSSALELRGDERVLEVGTGSGYQTAILCLLARRVVSVERHAGLLHTAAERLRRLGYHNAELHLAGETLGWPSGAPYDAILCAAGSPHVPLSLAEQLAPRTSARLVLPVGPRDAQKLLVVSRDRGGFAQRSLGPVRFVPLIGADAWKD